MWVLLHRESRNLDADNKIPLNDRFAGLVKLVGDRIAEDRSGIASGDAQLCARAVLAALSAPSQYRQTLPPKPFSTSCTAITRISPWQRSTWAGAREMTQVAIQRAEMRTPLCAHLILLRRLMIKPRR